MKNWKPNWYKINFILSCVLWGLVIICVLIIYFKPNETNDPNIESKESKIETIEEDLICYASAESYATYETVPFFEISEDDRYYIECIVAGETEGESLRGKKLVAQCILNAMTRTDWSPEEVKFNYQYNGWKPELEFSNPKEWADVELAVSEIFDNGNLETYELILYFYAPQWSSGSWHENNLEYVLTEGGHRFFKLKGE